jgi:hypothetical protein
MSSTPCLYSSEISLGLVPPKVNKKPNLDLVQVGEHSY